MNQVTASNYMHSDRRLAGAITGTQLFHTCCWLYMVAFFILPNGFGFRLGFLWSAKRIMSFVCYAMILFNRERLNAFWNDLKTYRIPNLFFILHMFIRLYTAIYRRDLNTIYGAFLDEVLVFYLFAYIFKYEISLAQFLRFIRITLLILCLEGIWEAITQINLFGLISFAADNWSVYATRAGGSRISGNCPHSIIFGIYLTILFFLSCYDERRNTLYLFRSPWLFCLASVCVFLTGSRAPLGIYILGLFLICLFSPKNERIKSLLALLSFASAFALFTMIVYRTEIGRQIMYMLTNMWDAIFDTRFADAWGGTAIDSTNYRDALAKVFEIPYLNKFVGRGVTAPLSVVIDGVWIRSCDNSYVQTFFSLAYPGMVMLILHGVMILAYSFVGLLKQKQYLFGATVVITIAYYINIWYVAQMDSSIYMWMLFALVYMCSKNEFITEPEKEFSSECRPI